MSQNLERAKRLFTIGETMQVERFAELFADSASTNLQTTRRLIHPKRSLTALRNF